MKEQGDTAREVEAKKMAAKEAIITSKQPMTKAENQQTGSRNEQRKKKKKNNPHIAWRRTGQKGREGGGGQWARYSGSNEEGKAIKMNGSNEPDS